MEYSKLTMKLASEQDVDDIQAIVKESFGEYVRLAGIPVTVSALTETRQDILNDIENKKVFAVFTDNGTLAGTVRIKTYMSENGELCAYFSRFAVKNCYRKNGVGRFIMDEIDCYLKKENVRKLYLHTALNATGLVNFYKGKGFYIESSSDQRGYVRVLMCKDVLDNNLG